MKKFRVCGSKRTNKQTRRLTLERLGASDSEVETLRGGWATAVGEPSLR